MRGTRVICLSAWVAGCLSVPESPPNAATTATTNDGAQATSVGAAEQDASVPSPSPSEVGDSGTSAAVATDGGATDAGASPHRGLSAEQIRTVVMAALGSFQACYENELAKDHETKGGITVSFQIGKDGSVVKAEVSSSSLGKPTLDECMVATFRKLKFPSADRRTSASFPFVFKGKR